MNSHAVLHRPAMARYVTVLCVGFTMLYLLTRTSVQPGDRNQYVNTALAGDPSLFHYGNPSHFLQIPLSRGIWLVSTWIGMPLSMESIVVALALIGTLAAIVFVGLIAARLTQTTAAAWLAAILFGTSLHVWTQVNGEQYGLALGFVTAALWFALSGRIVLPAILWAFAMLAHSEFVMAGVAFVMAVWISRPPSVSAGEKLRAAAVLVALAGSVTPLIILVWSRALGKWSTPTSLVTWIGHIFYVDHQYTLERPEVFRAMKGLVTALTVSGHFWRDVLTGRGNLSDPVFALESGIGLVVLVMTAVFLVAAVSQRRLFFFALAWLLPFHVLGNWWFEPTVEKYHAGALPGFVLLVTGGLVQVGARWASHRRYWLWAGYLSACAGLNLVGALLPMQGLGKSRIKAEQELRQLNEQRGGKVVFLTCDAPAALEATGINYYRLRSYWTGTVPEIQARVISWVQASINEGKEPYLVGQWCHPEEWMTQWSQVPFDLYFLKNSFQMTPTGITGIPLQEPLPTDPFSWQRGDIVRLEEHPQ